LNAWRSLNRARLTSRGTLKRARGSLWLPPGRQSRPRDPDVSRRARCAAFASSSDSQKRPKSNHSNRESGCVRCSCTSVGTSASRSRARNDVGCAPETITQ
jgi:hypothetical protein